MLWFARRGFAPLFQMTIKLCVISPGQFFDFRPRDHPEFFVHSDP
jgi:hypothetical protein